MKGFGDIFRNLDLFLRSKLRKKSFTTFCLRTRSRRFRSREIRVTPSLCVGVSDLFAPIRFHPMISTRPFFSLLLLRSLLLVLGFCLFINGFCTLFRAFMLAVFKRRRDDIGRDPEWLESVVGKLRRSTVPAVHGSTSWSRPSVTHRHGRLDAKSEMYPFPVKRYFRF